MSGEQNPVGLLVLGMHRSGTSALTGALQCLGVNLGRELYEGHAGINPRGYFENSDIVDLDDEFMLALGTAWDALRGVPDGAFDGPDAQAYGRRLAGLLNDQLLGRGPWAVKDPRMCRLLPWWLGVLDGLGCDCGHVLMARHPLEVAASLQKRDGFSRDKALMLWIDHNLAAERYTRGRRRVCVTFEAFLGDPGGELARVSRALGFDFPAAPGSRQAQLQALVSSDLRHHVHGDDVGGDVLARIARDVHSALREAAAGGFSPDVETRLDDAAGAYAAYLDSLPGFLLAELAQLGRDKAHYQLLWTRISRSWSWPLGRPLRFLERKLGRDV